MITLDHMILVERSDWMRSKGKGLVGSIEERSSPLNITFDESRNYVVEGISLPNYNKKAL